jgi:hypothetical protein
MCLFKKTGEQNSIQQNKKSVIGQKSSTVYASRY